MNWARRAHHTKTIFTHKNFLPDFLSIFSFRKQQQKTHNTFHFMLNKSSLVKNKLDFFKDEISLEREASLDKLNTGCLLVLQVLRAKYSDIT